MGPRRRQHHHLPEDIIVTEILTRLPVESLLRFRSVCKLWNSLMSDPDFVKSHLNYTTRKPNDYYFLIKKSITHVLSANSYCYRNTLLVFSLSECRVYDPPRPNQSRGFRRLLGSINGLVCLFGASQFVIWNPAIRQAKNIDAPVRQPEHYLSGFCWDTKENDYKVVICIKHSRIFPQVIPNFSTYVYSCNSGSWSLLPNTSFPEYRVHYWEQCVIVKGIPYWAYSGYSGEIGRYVSYVIKFEARRNEFRMLPEFDRAGSGQKGFVIVELEECISVLVYNASSSHSSVDVYYLDDRCLVWSKMYNVRQVTGHAEMLSRCLKDDSEIVFTAGGELKCYDQKTNEVKGLETNIKINLQNCFSYKAGLLLLEGMKPA